MLAWLFCIQTFKINYDGDDGNDGDVGDDGDFGDDVVGDNGGVFMMMKRTCPVPSHPQSCT